VHKSERCFICQSLMQNSLFPQRYLEANGAKTRTYVRIRSEILRISA